MSLVTLRIAVNLTLEYTGQRWQTHLTLSRPLNRGRGIGGVLAPLAGSAYMVWYVYPPW